MTRPDAIQTVVVSVLILVRPLTLIMCLLGFVSERPELLRTLRLSPGTPAVFTVYDCGRSLTASSIFSRTQAS